MPDGSGMGQVDVDDAFISLVEFDNGAIGTIEASRFCQGRKNYNCIEINGENGTIQFNLERMNELNVFWAGENPKKHAVSIMSPSPNPTIPTGKTGGPRATSSAGNIRCP